MLGPRQIERCGRAESGPRRRPPGPGPYPRRRPAATRRVHRRWAPKWTSDRRTMTGTPHPRMSGGRCETPQGASSTGSMPRASEMRSPTGDVPSLTSLSGGEVRSRDQQSQSPRMNGEPQGVSVRAPHHRCPRTPFRTATEPRTARGELVPVPAAASLTQGGEGDDLCRLASRRRGDGNDAQGSRVEAAALRRIQRGAEHVGVVRHLDQERAVYLGAVGLGELEVEWSLRPCPASRGAATWRSRTWPRDSPAVARWWHRCRERRC